ncbi:MAG: phage late control D family protein [Deltaproteobacteria bacterium]|nr:phage late control D family protein [Deltaproteobacteria bacterium]
MTDRSAPGIRVSKLPDEKSTSGVPLDLKGRIIGFTFDDSERKADKLSLQLDNFDLSLFDDEALMGGSVLEVSWGYPGNMAPPRRVVVKKVKGFTALTIEGQALSALMNREAKTRCFESRTRSEVVRKIAKEYGFEGEFLDVEDTAEVFDVINQTSETDARFLRRLAAREEFEFYVDEGGLHFHERRQDAAPTHVITWYADPGRGDVISINVESDLMKRVGKVTVRGRDPLTRTTVEASAANDTANRTTLSEVVEVVDPETGATAIETRNATVSVHPSAATTQSRASRESAARYRRAERATIKLSMKVVGDPTLHAKSIVEVRGISGLLSGKYYVTNVKHIISASGYVCDLKLTKDGAGRRARQLAQQQQGASNTSTPRNDSKPTQVEAVDPETGQTRIEYRQDGRRVGLEDPESKQS